MTCINGERFLLICSWDTAVGLRDLLKIALLYSDSYFTWDEMAKLCITEPVLRENFKAAFNNLYFSMPGWDGWLVFSIPVKHCCSAFSAAARKRG